MQAATRMRFKLHQEPQVRSQCNAQLIQPLPVQYLIFDSLIEAYGVGHVAEDFGQRRAEDTRPSLQDDRVTQVVKQLEQHRAAFELYARARQEEVRILTETLHKERASAAQARDRAREEERLRLAELADLSRRLDEQAKLTQAAERKVVALEQELQKHTSSGRKWCRRCARAYCIAVNKVC